MLYKMKQIEYRLIYAKVKKNIGFGKTAVVLL